MSQRPLQTTTTVVPNGTGSPFLDQQIALNQQLATLIANTTANFTDLYSSGGGGGGNVLRNGSGAPLNSLGTDGDFYIDTTAHNLYGPRANGVWPSGVAIVGPQGSAGNNGNTLNHGTGAPSSGVGNNGDFYIDTSANNIYGPKAAGAWGSATSLIGLQGSAGSNGNTILTTSGAPSNGTGNNGDFANDATAQVMYGPKAAGAWPAGVSYGAFAGSMGTKTLRNIATRCRHDYQLLGGDASPISAIALYGKSLHTNLGDSVSRLEGIVLGNWYADQNGEHNGAASINEYASIEYPAGFFTPVEWSTAMGTNHAPFVTIAPGADAVSDPIPVAIPHGAQFRVYRWSQSTSGSLMIFTLSASSTSGGSDVGFVYNTSAPTNDPLAAITNTANPAGTWTASGGMRYPLAILGMSSVPSVMIIGDSIASGRQDSTGTLLANGGDSGRWGIGAVARSVGYARPYTNMGCETDTIQSFNLAHTFRARQQTYHTDVVCEYGVNDLTAGRTAATILSALQSAWALFPTKNVWQTTITPITTSSDLWATTGNQTVVAMNPARITLNTSIRGVPSPLKGIFDIANVVETSLNSGIWNVIAGVGQPTGDGTHPQPLMYQYIQRSNALNPNLFT
jgi:hypothetical protein